jgi:hypothetical protein
VYGEGLHVWRKHVCAALPLALLALSCVSPCSPLPVAGRMHSCLNSLPSPCRSLPHSRCSVETCSSVNSRPPCLPLGRGVGWLVIRPPCSIRPVGGWLTLLSWSGVNSYSGGGSVRRSVRDDAARSVRRGRFRRRRGSVGCDRGARFGSPIGRFRGFSHSPKCPTKIHHEFRNQ